MELLVYKGIRFDHWEKETDDNGNEVCWAEMCDEHAEQYREILKDELSDGGMSACSICGCTKIGYDEENANSWYYVDFKTELIDYIEE